MTQRTAGSKLKNFEDSLAKYLPEGVSSNPGAWFHDLRPRLAQGGSGRPAAGSTAARHCWEAELTGVLGLGDLGHQNAYRGHGNDAGLLANSPVLLSRPEGAWKRVGRASWWRRTRRDLTRLGGESKRLSWYIDGKRGVCRAAQRLYRCPMRQVIPSKSGLNRSDPLRRSPAQVRALGKKRGREWALTCGTRLAVKESVGPGRQSQREEGGALRGRSGPRGKGETGPKPLAWPRSAGSFPFFFLFLFSFLFYFSKPFQKIIWMQINSHKKNSKHRIRCAPAWLQNLFLSLW